MAALNEAYEVLSNPGSSHRRSFLGRTEAYRRRLAQNFDNGSTTARTQTTPSHRTKDIRSSKVATLSLEVTPSSSSSRAADTLISSRGARSGDGSRAERRARDAQVATLFSYTPTRVSDCADEPLCNDAQAARHHSKVRILSSRRGRPLLDTYTNPLRVLPRHLLLTSTALQHSLTLPWPVARRLPPRSQTDLHQSHPLVTSSLCPSRPVLSEHPLS